MTLPASDNFTAANGTALTTYSSSWSLNVGNFEIINNAIRANGGLIDMAARWSADAFTADHYAQLKFNRIIGDCYIGPAVRVKTDGSANFYAYYSSAGLRYMFKVVGGSSTYLASGANLSDQIIVRLDIEGSTLTPKLNGSLDTEFGAQTDSAHAAGAAGICGYNAGSGSTGDDFLADNIGAAPPPLTIQEPALFPNPRIYFYQ
jgi:hypothetical protein